MVSAYESTTEKIDRFREKRAIVFLYPYKQLLDSAAWTLQQGLDGYGVKVGMFDRAAQGDMSPFFSSVLSHHEYFFDVLRGISVLLMMLLIVAGYILARKKGVLAVLVISVIPGVLSMVSLWPATTLLPDTYVEGGHGVMGSGWGMGVLVAIGMLSGWCLMLILVDLRRLDEKFWHVYDHVWVIAGLLAAVIFVADTQVNFHKQKLDEDSHTTQAASAYLAKQAVGYVRWCRENDMRAIVSCRWASLVQQKLLDYSTQHTLLYQEFGPQNSAQIYAWPAKAASPAEIEAIRTEIAAYNEKTCPIIHLGGAFSRTASPSPECLATPPQYGSALPDPFGGRQTQGDLGIPVALDIESIVPTLVRLRDSQERMQAKVDADNHTKYVRWLYYLFFSVIVGGKVAGSTVKLEKLDKREVVESRRSCHFVCRVACLLLRFVQTLLRLVTLIVLKILKSFSRKTSSKRG
ncbi:hypothetical protein [Paraburkholderia tropica]|uniref:hypothetical protein n=1 Tax=Paraburkholderia tropica TaxID=92647 RepID=UPI002ABDFC8F|nr:hypothetical protein [Paraburkholderia tropica]